MSDEIFSSIIILSTFSAILIIAFLAIYWSDIQYSIMRAMNNKKQKKYGDCFHLWRKLDGDYARKETVYRYRCEKCKMDKYLKESEAVKFERDFMNDFN